MYNEFSKEVTECLYLITPTSSLPYVEIYFDKLDKGIDVNLYDGTSALGTTKFSVKKDSKYESGTKR